MAWTGSAIILGGTYLVYRLLPLRTLRDKPTRRGAIPCTKAKETSDQTVTKAPSREKIIEATTAEVLESHKRLFYENIRGFRYVDPDLPDGTCFWVKYTSDSRLLAGEANTQIYVRAELAKADEKTRQQIYIPQVFDFVEADIEGMSYGMIVMEYVTAFPINRIVGDLQPWRKVGTSRIRMGNEERVASYRARVVEFIHLLLSISPPPGTSPGPVGGGRILHFVFGEDECEAPKEFSDIKELEAHINQSNAENFPSLLPIDLTKEGLKLCCCDHNFANFLLDDREDPSSRMTVIDFEHVNWLPYSFLLWKLRFDGERTLEDEIRSCGQLEAHQDNIIALEGYRITRWRAAWIPMS